MSPLLWEFSRRLAAPAVPVFGEGVSVAVALEGVAREG